MRSPLSPRATLSRRSLFAAAGAAGAGAAGLAIADRSSGEGAAAPLAGCPSATPAVPFHGRHQAGVTTPPPSYLLLAGFDLGDENVEVLRGVLATWTAAAARLARGDVAQPPPDDAAWSDSGESAGLGPSRLTVTVGLGPTLFERDGRDPLGLRAKRPPGFRALPAFAGDALDPPRSGGDLGVQICADDEQVAFHALHTLTRLTHDALKLRWTQAGFRRAPAGGGTPRNLLGFKDGTRNVDAADAAAMAAHVWVDNGWMRGGTYLVARRIRTVLDVWDVTGHEEQERVIGRHKVSGAALGRRREHDSFGAEELPAGAHVREAAPETNGGAALLRRGYNYNDGLDPATGQLDAGLVFISFQRSVGQFVRIQRRLAAHDLLNKHILHTASAVFAVPPGVPAGGTIGETLFTS